MTDDEGDTDYLEQNSPTTSVLQNEVWFSLQLQLEI